MTKTIKLTDKQIEAIYQAITIFEGSYGDYSDADLKFFDVKRELLALRQVQAKLDAATERVGA